MLQASVAAPRRRFPNRTRARVAVLAVAAFLLAPGGAVATPHDALVPAGLANAAQADPGRSFRVIVQGDGVRTLAVADAVAAEIAADPGNAKGLRRQFAVISGVAAELTGRQVLALAHRPSILAITPDTQLRNSDLSSGPTPVSAPTVAGDAVEGGTLSATTGSWTGTDPITYAYQWQFCDAAGTCSDIAGQTEASLVVPVGAAGSLVRVVVTATDATGAPTSASSAALAIAEAPSAPAPPPPPAPVPPVGYEPPAVTGDAQQGAVLTASDGAWTASAPVSITYQWQRCDSAFECVDIAGATSSPYTPVLEDVGSALRVVVTATSVDGSASAPSNPTPAIRPLLYGGVWSSQIWPAAAGLPALWEAVAQTPAPVIAVVDSGIDPNTPDVAGRIVDQVTITESPNNSPGDGRGHGTLVASLAAGNANGRAGAAPGAKLVSLDVLDDQGMAQTSDVIAAADWIYQHKDADRIRVANFSLNGSVGASFQFDPLDRALERLWLSGVVVVAAAGNYAVNGQPSGVPFAPGNDPLVITVGANDTVGTASPSDDVTAPWSAFGSTIDGFGKPDLGAPGRMLIGAVPTSATLTTERPDRVVGPGLMQLSGTSLATPIVAGAAADILALHPAWTPDQVKGALMASATTLQSAVPESSGLGEINAAAAARLDDPPNPNAALEQFLVPGSPPSIDTDQWATAAAADPAWASAYWGSAYWGSAYWGSTVSGASYWDSTYLGAAYWGSSYWGSTINDANGDGDPPAPGAYSGSVSPDVVP
jgi:subtilisin family serine protease